MFTQFVILILACLPSLLHPMQGVKEQANLVTPQKQLENFKVEQQRMLDVGNNQLMPLAKVWNYPILYKRLSAKISRFKINDERLSALGFFYNQENGIIADVRMLIFLKWYEIDPELRKNTEIIYGSDEKLFPPKDKQAFTLLCEAEKLFIYKDCGETKKRYKTRISDYFRNLTLEEKDAFFYAAQCEKYWGNTDSRIKRALEILPYLFGTCTLPKKQKYNIKNGNSTITTHPNGIITINGWAARPSFANMYYNASHEYWSTKDAQQFVKDKTYCKHEVLPNNPNKFIFYYADGSYDIRQKGLYIEQ